MYSTSENPTHMYKYIFPPINNYNSFHIFYHTIIFQRVFSIFSFLFLLLFFLSLFLSYLFLFSNIFTHGGSRIVRFNVKRALDRTERR